MPTLPTTGTLSASNIRDEFGISFSNALSWRGIHPNVPTTGELRFSQLRGISASTPSGTIGTQVVSTAGTGATNTISIGDFITDLNGRPFTSCTVSSYDSTYFSTVSMTGSNLSYTTKVNQWVQSSSPTYINCTVTNRFGKSTTISIPFVMSGTAMSLRSTIAGISLSGNNSQDISLTNVFNNYSPGSLTYYASETTYSSASIVNTSFVRVTAASATRNYNVTISASNAYGQGFSTAFNVQTSSFPPPTIASTPTVPVLYEDPYIIDLTTCFNNATSYSVSSPVSGATLSNSTYCVIRGDFRSNLSYNVTINGTNAGGTTSQNLLCTEGAFREHDYIWGWAGTYTWKVPGGCSNISMCCIGGGGGGAWLSSGLDGAGGGGGGALVYKNSWNCTPGTTLTIIVGNGGGANTAGGDSKISYGGYYITGGGGSNGIGMSGGQGGWPLSSDYSTNGTFGGNGGSGVGGTRVCGGGGGAGGFNSNGGNGGGDWGPATGSTGGGGGGGFSNFLYGGAGGGVNVTWTTMNNGTAGTSTNIYGGGGTRGSAGTYFGGGNSGGGGGGSMGNNGNVWVGRSGVARIICTNRTNPRIFPTNAATMNSTQSMY